MVLSIFYNLFEYNHFMINCLDNDLMDISFHISDYDCLIAEDGDLTPKYFKAKEIIQRLASEYGKHCCQIMLNRAFLKKLMPVLIPSKN